MVTERRDLGIKEQRAKRYPKIDNDVGGLFEEQDASDSSGVP